MAEGRCRSARVAPALCAIVLALLAAGCAAHRAGEAPPPPLPPPSGPRIAAAPMENLSNDLDAQEIIRRAFVEEAAARGWNVMPTAESDRLLRETLGISYGGQLGSTSPAEVCKALGVEAVVYGDVLEWNKTTAGVYNAVSVRAEFRMYGKGGALLWKGSDRQAQSRVPQLGRDAGAEILVHAIGTLLLNPMTPYGVAVGKNIARQRPAGVLAGAAGGGP